MPFIIQCPFCNLRAPVPDRANGAVGKCPKCATSFTLAPAEDQDAPELVDVLKDPSSSDLEPIGSSAMSAAIAAASAAAETPSAADEPAPEDDDDQPPSRARAAPETMAAAVA